MSLGNYHFKSTYFLDFCTFYSKTKYKKICIFFNIFVFGFL